MYAISDKGKLIWKYNAGTGIEAPPFVQNNTVFAGSLEGIVFAIYAKTGKVKWKYVTEGQISGAINYYIIQNKVTRLVVGSYDYSLHCIDELTGHLIWKFLTDNYINGTPATDGKVIVFGGCDGQAKSD